jgi:hypothetical protein
LHRLRKEDAYSTLLAGRLNTQERNALIEKLVKRAQQPRSEDAARGKSRFTEETDLSAWSS